MSDAIEAQDTTAARPTKRIRLEGSLATSSETQEEMADEDDWDDIYGEGSTVPDNSMDVDPNVASDMPLQKSNADADFEMPDATRPPPEPTFQPPTSHVAALEDQGQSTPDISAVKPEESGNRSATHAQPVSGDELVAPVPPVESTDPQSTTMVEETTQVHAVNANGLTTSVNATSSGLKSEENSEGGEVRANAQDINTANHTTLKNEAGASLKSTDDPEFMAAAAAQKGEKGAEWQFDSSDAESSSDSDSTDSSDDDSDSEGGYEMLDPVTAAKMLMSGDGDDDEDGEKSKSKGNYQPRTTNEKPEEVFPKPDVEITPDMKITFLGAVERIVENLLLIKGVTPGEYQVIESGSVLCTEDRKVIGAVAETFGRVQEPMYSVMFTTSEDITAAGLEFGTKLFYVDSHSTFVFTQPLRNLKGTDASNIHDEEVAEDELEFSDDEVEAEYKRQKKMAKKAGRGGLSRGDFNDGVRIPHASNSENGPSYNRGNDAPPQSYGGGMSYDDEPADEFYMPLKRPENLSQLMADGPSRPPQQSFDRGRGRGAGRGRGRGDRGRGRGGFEPRGQRGGRGGHNNNNNNNNPQSHRGNAQSFPDRHNTHSDAPRQEKHSLPPRPADRAESSLPAFPGQPSHQPAPPASTYQFNGFTFQYGTQPPAGSPQQQYPPGAYPPPPFAASVPPGSYVNPAFAHPQYPQQASSAHPQYPQQAPSAQSYPAWSPQPPQQQYQQQPHQYVPQQHQQYQYPQPAPQPPTAAGQQQPPQQSFPPDLSEILKSLKR
jgi:H/ACA ribonucleoprotein complex non-core subunit NAF1